MEDFAYLFPDSAASWLEGRGDVRFRRYEFYHRNARASSQDETVFDLERFNERYAITCGQARGRIVSVLDSKYFKRLILCLVLLWGGAKVLPTVGHSQPTATGIVLVALLVASRVKDRRTRAAKR